MRDEKWETYTFSDFADMNPSVKLTGGGAFSFVEMKDLNNGQRNAYPSADREISGGARFQNGDTLFARITPCLENGKICQVRGLKNNIGFGSTEFLVFRGKPGVSDTDFVFYLARYEEVRKFAEQNMVGTSGRQRVGREAFENLILDLPPLPTQRRIASILTALDDKIELNRRMNETLEGIAQALWGEWFGKYVGGEE
jgi:type I restriction enzyme S subunit